MTTRTTFLLASVCLISISARADEAGPGLQPEDILNLTWAIHPEVSPDGAQLLYTVFAWRDGQRTYSKWLTEAVAGSTPRQILDDVKGVTSVRWSPDGKMTSFLATGSSVGQGKQLYIAKADASAARCLTAMPNGIGNYRWSADSKAIAFTADERPQEQSNIVVVGSSAARAALWKVKEV